MGKARFLAGGVTAVTCIISGAPAWAQSSAVEASGANAGSRSDPRQPAPVTPAGQTGVAPAPAETPDQADTAAEPPDIIVTGSARQQRRFDVSYAVNSLGQDDIKKLAPQSFADLLGKLPGIQVEPTGGEVQNITRVRGIPTDDGLAMFQQDGLPLFEDINGNFFRGDSLNRYDLMTQRVEVVRGGPAPIYSGQAAAIINNITVTGTDVTHGKLQLTGGTTGLYRADGYQAGPLGGDTYYAIGGYLRHDDGHRDNGFPNDRGGQIRASLKHDVPSGFVKLSVNYLNDIDVFYLPIPVADPRNPTVSLDPYIDYFTGTLNSPAFQNVTLKYRDIGGIVRNQPADLSDGRHMQYANLGFDYEDDLSGWLVSFKLGYTQGRLNFDALYSTSNPVDGTTFANSFLTRAQTAFGAGVTRLGYALGGTNGATVYNPASASGLVVQAQYRSVQSDFYSGQGDLSVTHKFDTSIGSHDVRVGFYASAYGENNEQLYQDYLMEVAGKPRTLDLIAYSATGAVLGRVTDNGVLRYGTTLNRGSVDSTVYAAYANDTWEVTPNLRLDGGIRHETYRMDGHGLLSTAVNLGDATTLADDAVQSFSGSQQTHRLTTQILNWTVGANYDLTPSFGGYVRASHLEVPPVSTLFYSINPVIIKTKANQYEAGLKASFGRSYLYLTGFYTKFTPLNSSFVPFNPVTGATSASIPFISDLDIKGVEADGALNVVRWFSLSGSFTAQNPKYVNLQPSTATGLSPAAVEGKQVIREPKYYGNLRASFSLEQGDFRYELYGRAEVTGRRYVDFTNFTELPAYHSFSAGLLATYRTFQFQVVGDNIANNHGLTEGNTRTDQLSGQGTRVATYGRPIFGRSVRFIVSTSW